MKLPEEADGKAHVLLRWVTVILVRSGGVSVVNLNKEDEQGYSTFI